MKVTRRTQKKNTKQNVVLTGNPIGNGTVSQQVHQVNGPICKNLKWEWKAFKKC